MIDHFVEKSVSSALFNGRKRRLRDKLNIMIDRLTPAECIKKWKRGEKVKGEMTKKELLMFNARENLKEELIDAFWYSSIEDEQCLMTGQELPLF